MSFQYMPLYTGDYLRDTQHLSCSEHGIFLKLLMHCWDQKGPAPIDERKLCGIVNARSGDEIEAMRRILEEFFLERADGHYNVRMQKEIERSESISGARSVAGKAGYQAKAKQLLNKSLASATTISPSPSLTLIPKKTVEDSAEARAPTPPAPFLGDANEAQIPSRAMVAIAGGWELPTSWGTDAEQIGFKSSEILREAEKFRQYWTVGKGSGKRRTVKGWRQSWSNWLSKAETRARA